MRRTSLIIALIFCFTAGTALAHYPTTVKMDAAAKKQGPVTFDHAKHGDKYVKSCDVCHHQEKGLTKAQADKINVKKCTGCHLDAKGKVPSMRDMNMAKNPFHIRCVGCHKAEKKGPVACTGCHKK